MPRNYTQLEINPKGAGLGVTENRERHELSVHKITEKTWEPSQAIVMTSDTGAFFVQVTLNPTGQGLLCWRQTPMK
jgi:hypothetical protein